MPRSLVWLVILSGLAVHAQSLNLCTVEVNVVLADKHQPVSGARVELDRAASGSPSRVAVTSSSGSAQFENLMPGDYRVVVTGEGFEPAYGPLFRVNGQHVFENQFIAVRRLEEDKAGGPAGAGNSVNVHNLNVPSGASEELERGNSEMQHKHYKEAAEHYSKAIAIYPQYSLGYYNLSVAYRELDQTDNQRDALQKALGLDDHCVPALVGLAHLEFADHKIPETKDLLDKAISADPTNVDALALRVRVDYMQGQYQDAIADAQRVHSLPHNGYASVHYTAAAAYQQLNRIPEMINELKTYLKEDPTSSNASYVRQEIVAEGGTPD